MNEDKTKKTWLSSKKVMLMAGVVVFAAGIVTAFLFLRLEFYFEPENHLAIYFFSPSEGRLSPEWRMRPEYGDTTSVIDMLFAYLQETPQSSRHSRVWPDTRGEALITSLLLDDDMLVVELSEVYLDISPLDEAIFRSALTLTMTGLSGVDRVKLVVPGRGDSDSREVIETAATIANDPAISPARIAADQFTLFFVHESGEGLVIEEYVAPEVNRLRREFYIMERLITGPSYPYMTSAIPPETQVRNVFAHSEAGAIYVDLSTDFVNHFSGTTAQARMMLASIANTLIENTGHSGIRRVVFLINSERREEFHGVGDFGSAFTFDASLILDGDIYGDRLFLEAWEAQEQP